MTTEIPELFNWVTARSKCNGSVLFEELRRRVENDCKKAKELPSGLAECSNLKITDLHSNRFVVKPGVSERACAFDLLQSRPDGSVIRVTTHDTWTEQRIAEFEARPRLLDNGDCRFEIADADGKVESKRLTLWQVSRRALESLIFEQPG